jgi:protein transport protein SEC61 subunit gamma-like protein
MSIVESIKNFLEDSKRIFVVSKKPTLDEYKRMAIIVALGILVIGFLGYIIYLIFGSTGIGIL